MLALRFGRVPCLLLLRLRQEQSLSLVVETVVVVLKEKALPLCRRLMELVQTLLQSWLLVGVHHRPRWRRQQGYLRNGLVHDYLSTDKCSGPTPKLGIVRETGTKKTRG